MATLGCDAATAAYTASAYGEVVDFVYSEAAALDERRHREWLALLTDDIVYRMPVRVTTAHTLDDSLLVDMAHFDEDRYSLAKRVERFEPSMPGPRTRRRAPAASLSNVRGWQGDDGRRDLVARSVVLLFRSRGDVQPPDLISAGAPTRCAGSTSGLKLARREILASTSRCCAPRTWRYSCERGAERIELATSTRRSPCAR